ncbi:IS110 family transposase [Ruminococcus albus]|uniref:Transposase n=1 Tax=Ruminococcus albus TaxID=1264 RepID=A0A1H7KP20_RUMAL|nr:transposase [Ruminococcus albus]SEK88488.1 Transposase [Ruminococcus albus]
MKVRIYPQDIPVMGIDFSKEKSDFCVLDVSNKIVKRGIVHHTPDSITDFLEKLSTISDELDAILVCIMEATAHYHRILYKQLVDNGYTVMVINPIQSESIKNVDI